ncbi:MAG: chromate transporter [Halanaerobiaceae bacterium]
MILFELYFIFLKIGLFTFGGGYAMLPLIQEEMLGRGWLTAAEFLDIVAVAEMTPGAIAVSNATFIGYRLAGIPGALATTLGLISPSLIIIIIVATVFKKFKDNPLVRRAWEGIRPAVVGLIFATVYSLGKEAINSVEGMIIAIIALGLVAGTRLHPIFIIIISGFLGLGFTYLPLSHLPSLLPF